MKGRSLLQRMMFQLAGQALPTKVSSLKQNIFRYKDLRSTPDRTSFRIIKMAVSWVPWQFVSLIRLKEDRSYTTTRTRICSHRRPSESLPRANFHHVYSLEFRPPACRSASFLRSSLSSLCQPLDHRRLKTIWLQSGLTVRQPFSSYSSPVCTSIRAKLTIRLIGSTISPTTPGSPSSSTPPQILNLASTPRW